MSRGSRHVHYDDDLHPKMHKGSHHRRQRRRRRVGRRAKIYGAAFLLALTGFFCLVPGTSLTVVAFTNGTDSRENILRLLGPVFGGVGVILVGISIGLVCYAMLYKYKVRKAKERQREAEDSGFQGSIKRDGDKLAAEVRLLDAGPDDPGTVKVKHSLVPNYGNYHHGNQHRSADPPVNGSGLPANSTVNVDIIHPPHSDKVGAIGQGESSPGTSQASKERFQTANAVYDPPNVTRSAGEEQCGATLITI